MSTFSYNGYTLNGYLNTPNYDTEIQLFKDILDTLPERGTTYVSTEHHHSRLSCPSSDSDVLTCGESGVMGTPFLSAGVMVVNGSQNISTTTTILGYVNTPGEYEVLYGGTTGIGGTSNFKFDSTTWVHAPNYRANGGVYGFAVYDNASTAVGLVRSKLDPTSLSFGDGETGADVQLARTAYGTAAITNPNDSSNILAIGPDVYTTALTAYSPPVRGITGTSAATGIYCYYKSIGKDTDYYVNVGGYTGLGGTVRIGLPRPANSIFEFMRYPIYTKENTTVAIGSARMDTGLTGLLVYPNVASETGGGWYGGAGVREVKGLIRYVAE